MILSRKPRKAVFCLKVPEKFNPDASFFRRTEREKPVHQWIPEGAVSI